MMDSIHLDDGRLHLLLTVDEHRVFAQLQPANSKAARSALATIEVYDRTQQRVDSVNRFDNPTLQRTDSGAIVVLESRQFGIRINLELTLLAGELSVRLRPSEIVEHRPELYRLFTVLLLPELMRVDPAGDLLLPINTGVIVKPATAPACTDRFLIYGEQPRWELLPTLPICASNESDGGWTAIAVSAPAETLCLIRTDGKGNGTVGMGLFLRGLDVDPVEPEVREIRYTPIPPGADLLAFAAGRLRRHIMHDLGKPLLRQRAEESPEVAHLLGAYIMKLFFGMQMQGQAAGSMEPAKAPHFLTTMIFDEAGAGLKALHDAGVDKIYTQNVGWNLLGHDGAYPTRFPVEERVGGEAAFRRFIALGHSLGDQMTVHDNYIDAYESSPDFDREVITVDAYGQMQIRGFWAAGASYLCWPLAFGRHQLEEQMLKVKALGIRGPYYLDGMGSPLYMNYHPRHRGSRSDLARGIDRLLKAARSIYNSVATESGFLYCSITPDLVAHPGGENLMKLAKPHWPITPLLDRCVPLWQMVMNGLVVSENQGLGWTDTMRALLYAQHPRYEWSTRPGIHPVLDNAMIRKIKYRYDLLIKRFGHLRLQQMTSFKREGTLETTTFEDGTTITANFATGELSANGEPIERPAIFQS